MLNYQRVNGEFDEKPWKTLENHPIAMGLYRLLYREKCWGSFY
jgi:hypothetical protein